MANTKLIEQLRIQHGYTQEQMARLIGYDSQAAYSRKIKGIRQFTIEDIVKICNLFQLEPNDLIIM